MPSRCQSIAVAAAVAAAITAARTWLIIDQPPACSSYIRQLLYGSTVTLHRYIFPQLPEPRQRHLQQQQPGCRSGNTGSITNSGSSTSAAAEAAAAAAARTSAGNSSSSNQGNINRISRNSDMGSNRGAAARTSAARGQQQQWKRQQHHHNRCCRFYPAAGNQLPARSATDLNYRHFQGGSRYVYGTDNQTDGFHQTEYDVR